jgi:hypothetical protein
MAIGPARVNRRVWRSRIAVTYCAEQELVQAVGVPPEACEEKGAG